MAVIFIDNMHKAKLDAEFSLVNSLNHDQIQTLTDDYEMLKSKMIQDVHDIAEKLRFLYGQIRKSNS